jgi:hypothetical protein
MHPGYRGHRVVSSRPWCSGGLLFERVPAKTIEAGRMSPHQRTLFLGLPSRPLCGRVSTNRSLHLARRHRRALLARASKVGPTRWMPTAAWLRGAVGERDGKGGAQSMSIYGRSPPIRPALAHPGIAPFRRNGLHPPSFGSGSAIRTPLGVRRTREGGVDDCRFSPP